MSNKAFRSRTCGRCGITFIQLRAGHPAFSPRPYSRILRIVYSEQSPSRIYPSNRVYSKELCSECAASFAQWLSAASAPAPASVPASTSAKKPKEPITMPTLPFSLDPSVETLATQRADRQQTADTAIKLMRNLYRDLLQ